MLSNSDCANFLFSRFQSFEYNKDIITTLYDFVCESLEYDVSKIDESQRSQLIKRCDNFVKRLKEKLDKCKRNKSRLKTKHADWLSEKFLNITLSISKITKAGRPASSCCYDSLSKSSKRRKISGLIQDFSSSELIDASTSKLRSEGESSSFIQTQ